MNIIWFDAKKRFNISDASFEDIVEHSMTDLTQDDKDFILTSFGAGMYNYVVEYVYNKAKKILQDAVFSIGDDVVLNMTHWVDRTFITRFFDVYILRLACNFGLISKEEKLEFFKIIEVLQNRKDSEQNTTQIDKEKAKFFIISLFNSVLFKDFTPFQESIKQTIEILYSEEIIEGQEDFEEIINSDDQHKNLLSRIIFAMLRIENVDSKRYKTLCKNAKVLLPKIWKYVSLNDKKFMAFYLKELDNDDLLKKLFDSLDDVKLQDFSTDMAIATKLLKNCQDALENHYSIANHKAEVTPLLNLAEVPSYPNLFLRSVVTPCLVLYLGNNFGALGESKEIAGKILSTLPSEKWTHYFKSFFVKDDFVLSTLLITSGINKEWCGLVKNCGVDVEDLPDENVKSLVEASIAGDFNKVKEYAKIIYLS